MNEDVEVEEEEEEEVVELPKNPTGKKRLGEKSN